MNRAFWFEQKSIQRQNAITLDISEVDLQLLCLSEVDLPFLSGVIVFSVVYCCYVLMCCAVAYRQSQL